MQFCYSGHLLQYKASLNCRLDALTMWPNQGLFLLYLHNIIDMAPGHIPYLHLHYIWHCSKFSIPHTCILIICDIAASLNHPEVPHIQHMWYCSKYRTNTEHLTYCIWCIFKVAVNPLYHSDHIIASTLVSCLYSHSYTISQFTTLPHFLLTLHVPLQSGHILFLCTPVKIYSFIPSSWYHVNLSCPNPCRLLPFHI